MTEANGLDELVEEFAFATHYLDICLLELEPTRLLVNEQYPSLHRLLPSLHPYEFQAGV